MLKFYIIYIPKSVSYLKYFACSFLLHSNFELCLVANGLSQEEIDELKQLCKISPRITFFHGSSSVIEHWQMLQKLFVLCQDEYFCVMDNDVIALGKIPEEVEQQIKTSHIFSSCSNYLVPGQQIESLPPGLRGGSTQSPSGATLSRSYFATYHRLSIQQVIEKTNVTFSPFKCPKPIPSQVRQRMHSLDREIYTGKYYIDTGKLLCLMAHSFKLQVTHCNFSNMVHLGGISRFLWLEKHREKILRILSGEDISIVLKNRKESYRRRMKIVNYFVVVLKRAIDGKENNLEIEDEYSEEIKDTGNRIVETIHKIQQNFFKT